MDHAPVRSEDSFDVAALDRWLTARVPGLTGPPEVRQFSGGASNLTYLLRYPERDLILRRPPAGHKAASAHDMGREVRVQSQLKPVYRYVPEIVASCDDTAVIGSDFYVMERLEGIILRQDLPEGLVLDEARARTLTTRAVETLIELHQIDPAAVGLDTLGRGPGYVARQVSGWSRRLRDSHTENVADFAAVIDWLRRTQPDDVAQRLIHGDFRLDNLVLDEAPLADGSPSLDVVGVLDWEMATVGDPLMDLGASLAYWVQADDDPVMQSARRQPTNLPGMLTRAEIVGRYCDAMGLSTDNWSFYEVYGLFRLAVIAQQIYYRYHHGQTTNPAFKDFWALVNYLEWRCRTVAGLD